MRAIKTDFPSQSTARRTVIRIRQINPSNTMPSEARGCQQQVPGLRSSSKISLRVRPDTTGTGRSALWSLQGGLPGMTRTLN